MGKYTSLYTRMSVSDASYAFCKNPWEQIVIAAITLWLLGVMVNIFLTFTRNLQTVSRHAFVTSALIHLNSFVVDELKYTVFKNYFTLYKICVFSDLRRKGNFLFPEYRLLNIQNSNFFELQYLNLKLIIRGVNKNRC